MMSDNRHDMYEFAVLLGDKDPILCYDEESARAVAADYAEQHGRVAQVARRMVRVEFYHWQMLDEYALAAPPQKGGSDESA